MGELGINEKGLLDTGYCRHCSKTTRCMMIVMILSGTMFIMTLGSCASSVYFFTQLKEFRQELNTLGKAHKSDGEMGSALQSQQQMDDNSPLITDESLDRNDRKTERRNKGRKDRRNEQSKERMRHEKNCRCKKLSGKQKKMVKDIIDDELKPLSKELEHQKEITTKMSKQFTYISAAHYTTFVDDEYIQEKLGKSDHGRLNETTMEVREDKWQGTLQRNRILISEEAPLTFKFLKEADWMKNLTSGRLFDYNLNTGKFRVRHTGLYNLYAHVLLYDTKTRMAVGIKHESGSDVMTGNEEHDSVIFKCMESTDYIDPLNFSSKFKTCNINGVRHLKEGDYISLQSLYRNMHIDLTSDATYFGAILFSSNAL